MFGRAARGHGVVLFFAEVLDRQVGKERFDVATGQKSNCRVAGPAVAVAVELAGDAAIGRERTLDALP